MSIKARLTKLEKATAPDPLAAWQCPPPCKGPAIAFFDYEPAEEELPPPCPRRCPFRNDVRFVVCIHPEPEPKPEGADPEPEGATP